MQLQFKFNNDSKTQHPDADKVYTLLVNGKVKEARDVLKATDADDAEKKAWIQWALHIRGIKL